MIGALIGDIAAWTYEHEQDTFWKQLIPMADEVQNLLCMDMR